MTTPCRILRAVLAAVRTLRSASAGASRARPRRNWASATSASSSDVLSGCRPSPGEHLLAGRARRRRGRGRRPRQARAAPPRRAARGTRPPRRWRSSARSAPTAFDHRELRRRHWGLERGLSEPPGIKPEVYTDPGSSEAPPHVSTIGSPTAAGPRSSCARSSRARPCEDDLIDQLVGPRGSNWCFLQLGNVSSRRRAERVGAGSATLAVVERVRERIIVDGVARGEAPTMAAEAVRTFSHGGGLDVVVAALVALGREKLVRGRWSTDGEGRAFGVQPT